MDPAVAAQCPPIVHPSDIASVGQPLPQAAETQPPEIRPSAVAVAPATAPQPDQQPTPQPQH
jgi:hypothetical protein